MVKDYMTNTKGQDNMGTVRGQLTTKTNEIALKMIGREITQTELRLLPYIQYVMTNDQKITPNRVNREEREILQRWKDEGHIIGGASGLAITKEFWDFICEVMFENYVDIKF